MNFNSRADSVVGAIFTLALVFCGTSTFAASDTIEASVIEEVIVTAERRSESVLDVPVTLTALSSSMIESLGITSADDLEQLVPGLQFGDNVQQQGQGTVMRGIGTKSAAGTHADEGVIVGILELLSNAAHGTINSRPTTLLLLLLRRRVTSSPEPLDSAGPSYCRGDHRHLAVKDSIDSFLRQIAHTLVYLISPQWIWGSAELQTLLNGPHIATQVSLELQAPGAANMLDDQ